MLDLAPEHLRSLRIILSAHVPYAKAWAFGSRVKGTSRPFSDLDLALEGDSPIDPRTLALLRDDLVESDLPMTVDVIDLKTTNPGFRALVEQQRVLIPT
ncbi:MAG TPA: nucleotidyltransferase domain-containing protein [Flavobacteriales bacterium]|nr:nucleotidyltransferase domain-containing protein [Flavobacteriales bacterium]HMR29015.1 nucleotidyltransferase domain-containing protein [Flavobacteriales bacterium]